MVKVTYKLVDLDKELDNFAKKENYRELKPGERMRCDACNSIYWRLFYDRAQCMGCRSITRVETEPLNGDRRTNDLRTVTWIRWQQTKYTDGRVRDPLRKRSEFVVFKNYLKCRVGGTELIIHPQLKGYWYYGKLAEKFKAMTPNQIMVFLKNGVENKQQ